jgi:hypothetical protein
MKELFFALIYCFNCLYFFPDSIFNALILEVKRSNKAEKYYIKSFQTKKSETNSEQMVKKITLIIEK